MIRMSYVMNEQQCTACSWRLYEPKRVEIKFGDSTAHSTDGGLIIEGDPAFIREALYLALQHLDAFDRAVAHGYVDVTDRYESGAGA